MLTKGNPTMKNYLMSIITSPIYSILCFPYSHWPNKPTTISPWELTAAASVICIAPLLPPPNHLPITRGHFYSSHQCLTWWGAALCININWICTMPLHTLVMSIMAPCCMCAPPPKRSARTIYQPLAAAFPNPSPIARARACGYISIMSAHTRRDTRACNTYIRAVPF